MGDDVCWFRVEYTSPCLDEGKTVNIGYVYALESASKDDIKKCIYRQIGLPPENYFPIEIGKCSLVEKVFVPQS